MYSKYPNTFYRVLLKAIIRNNNELLVAKEKDSSWSLPGGGMDHSETAHDALKRELYEEALIDAPFTEKIIRADSLYVKEKQAWLLWLVYDVRIENLTYGIGEHADDVTFIDPHTFKGSPHCSEQLVYKHTVEIKQL